MEQPTPLCASYGCEIQGDQVVALSLCPECEQKIEQANPAWSKQSMKTVDVCFCPITK